MFAMGLLPGLIAGEAYRARLSLLPIPLASAAHGQEASAGRAAIVNTGAGCRLNILPAVLPHRSGPCRWACISDAGLSTS